VAFSANGKVIASGSADQTVQVWDATTGQFLRSFSGCKGTIDALALSATGSLLASSSQDRTVRLWNVSTGRQMHCLKRPGSHVASLSFSSDGKTFQVCDIEGLVCRYNVESGKITGQTRNHNDGFASLLLGPDGLGLIGSTAEMGEEEWKKLLPRPLARRRKGIAPMPIDSLANLRQVRVSADGRLTATVENTNPGGRRGPRYRIRVWEVATGGLVAELPAVRAPVCSLAFSADGRFPLCSS
jgi:WD40 repeat protein